MKIYLSDIAAGNGGFKIVGECHGDGAGWTVSSAGDVNGDGIADLLVGAPYKNSTGEHYEGEQNPGAAYVVFGKTTAFGTVTLHDVAQGAGGFKIVGENGNYPAGSSLCRATSTATASATC